MKDALILVLLLLQGDIYFLPADKVVVRRMSDVPPVELASGVHVRTVVGTTGSFSLGEFEPGSAAVLHHHAREQADIGVSGSFDVTLGDHVEALRPGSGFIVPANVPHSIANNGSDPATVIEFHTMRRPDLVPPRPAMTFPASQEPARLPDGRHLIAPMESSTSPELVIRGETCVLSLRRVAGGAPPIEIRAGRVERFAYVVRGAIQLRSADVRDRVAAGSLIVVPAGGTITIQPVGTDPVTLAEFVPPAVK
jgi:quercetin dioxygenase-like cupin family protein